MFRSPHNISNKVEILISVDFGSTHIMLMAAERLNDGKLKVLGVEKAPTPEGSIKNGIIKKPSEISFQLGGLVKLMENRLGQKYIIKSIYASQSGCSLRTTRTNIQHTFSNATEITQNELNLIDRNIDLAQFNEKSILSIMKEEYNINGELAKDPIGKFANQITVNYLVAYGKNEIEYNFNRSFERTVFNQSNVHSVIAPVAIANAVLTNDDKIAGCAVVNFGASTTLVSVYKDGYLRHAAVVPFGSKHINNDLSELIANQSKIEAIKTNYVDMIFTEEDEKKRLSYTNSVEEGTIEIEYKDIYNYLEARLDETIGFVMDEIGSCIDIKELGQGLIITGGGAKLKNIDKYIAEKYEVDVRLGAHDQWLAEGQENYSGYQYAMLIGLIAKAAKNCVEEKEKENEEPTTTKPTKDKNNGIMGYMKKIGDLFSNEETIEE